MTKTKTKKILSGLGYVFGFGLLAYFLFQNQIHSFINGKVSEYVQAEEKENIGKKVSSSLKLITADGQTVDADGYFNEKTTALVYSDNCWPCKEAVKLANSEMKDTDKKLAVLVFSDELPGYMYKNEQIEYFRVDEKLNRTIFSVNFTPAFFQFDNEGVLSNKMVGWEEMEFLLMITE